MTRANDLGYQGEGMFNVERTARRDHRCDNCKGVIPAGSKYVRATASHDCPYTGDGWRTLKIHLRGECRRGY